MNDFLDKNSKTAIGTLEAAEKFGTGQERQGLKPDFFQSFMARLKSCPDTKQSFSVARNVVF
jgi:hypothetical protein